MDDKDQPFLPLYDQPGHIFRRCAQYSAMTFEREVGGLGITPPQFSALYAISMAPGMEQQEIARAIHYDAATTGAILARLQKLGAIRREPSGRSARGLAIYLSPQGDTLMRKVLPAIWRNQVKLLEPLTDDEKPEFLRLLSKAAGVENSFNKP
jgi:DNA-binding MarR family transcriptional regulator